MIFALSSVLLNAFAQITMKKATQVSMNTYWEYLKNPYLYGTLVLYSSSIVLWFIALSKLELSLAYPLQALGYLIVSVLSMLVLGEKLTSIQLLGSFVILLGVALTQLGRA